jgi:hypothetical protein
VKVTTPRLIVQIVLAGSTVIVTGRPEEAFALGVYWGA